MKGKVNMPAKKPVAKKKVVVSKSKKKSQPKGPIELPTDEAPIIIKGSAQGPNIEPPFAILSDYPMDFTFESTSPDKKPCIYTLSGTQQIKSIKIESAHCNCEITSGDFEITISLI